MYKPILSIIMPVYNTERYVGQAIQSILDQSFKNFELIIIEDGSTDNSLKVIESINDNRIELYKNDKNHGIVYSRNRGLDIAKGDYIGMVDSDDIVYPDKFEKQINFLEQNKEFGMVGSWVKFIDKEGKRLPGKWKLKASPDMIPSIMLFKNYFLQSAVLYKKGCISKFSFRNGFDILEDYLIWLEIIKYNKVWNMQTYFIDYRIHGESVTKKHIEKKRENEKKVFRIQFMALEIDATDHELELHMLIKNDKSITEINTLKLIEQWLLKIIKRNEKLHIYKDKILIKVVFNRWAKVCSKASGLRLKMLIRFFTSEISYIFIKRYILHL